MSKLEKQLEDLRKQEVELISQIKEEKSRKKFLCYCGKNHMIKDCVVIQTHWYTPPSGCTDGDYWNSGELRVVCPTTNVQNRVLFLSHHSLKWELRDKYEYNLEGQFSNKYKNLFKYVIDLHEDSNYKEYSQAKYGKTGPIPPEGKVINNYYFEKNIEKFGIKVDKSAFGDYWQRTYGEKE